MISTHPIDTRMAVKIPLASRYVVGIYILADANNSSAVAPSLINEAATADIDGALTIKKTAVETTAAFNVAISYLFAR